MLGTSANPTKQQRLQQARVKRLAAKQRFDIARKASKSYERQLLSVARQIKNVVDTFGGDVDAMQQALLRYEAMLEPWARAVASKMIADIGRRDAKAWMETSEEIGITLRKEMLEEPTGHEAAELLRLQVGLITSLPRETAEKIMNFSAEGVFLGMRASELVKKYGEIGVQAGNRARMIARTEVSRVGAVMLETRAASVGCEEYIWHTAGDADVRHEHAVLNTKTFKFSQPPVIGHKNGQEIRGNPGTIYYCRCWAEPILPDTIH